MAKEGNITITNMVYGLGAAIVIVGALFKIQHWPFGSEILTIGMIVEAGVFTYSAFERVKSDLDWSLVYPELSGASTSKSEASAPDISMVFPRLTKASLWLSE